MTRRTRLETRGRGTSSPASPSSSRSRRSRCRLDLFRGYESLAVFAGHVPADVAIAAPHEKEYAGGKKGGFIVVFTPLAAPRGGRAAAPGRRVFARDDPGRDRDCRPDAIARYRDEHASIAKELEGIERQLHGLSEIHASFLLAADELLTADVERAEAPLRFAVTDQAFVAEGWVPSDRGLPEITASLERVTNGKIHVEELPIDFEHDAVPVEYQNPPFAHPTELFMDVYSRPKYREIDPTLLVSIVFPIFFGMILGDVGYGLVLLAISFLGTEVSQDRGLDAAARQSAQRGDLLDHLRRDLLRVLRVQAPLEAAHLLPPPEYRRRGGGSRARRGEPC